MTVIDTISFPAPTMTGTQIASALPNNMGEARDNMLIELFQQGQCPLWLRQWVEIEVEEDGMSGTFYCLPDFLCVGTDDDYLYVSVGAVTAEAILGRFGAVLPTQKMVETIYQRSIKQVAQPWGEPYDMSMTYTSRWPTQTAKVRRKMGETGVVLGQLVEGHAKNVIASKKALAEYIDPQTGMVKNHYGVDLGFFGWYDANGKPIQGDSLAHGAYYGDYAHGVRGILNNVVACGMMMNVEEALDHEDAYKLFSHERFHPSTYLGARAIYQTVNGKPAPVKY